MSALLLLIFGSIFTILAHFYPGKSVFHFEYLVETNSGFIIAWLAFFLLLAFSNKKIHTLPSMIINASTLVFDIYIIHMHPSITSGWLWSFDKYQINVEHIGLVNFLLLMFGSVLLMFFGCLMIAIIKEYLFGILRIRKMCDYLERKIRLLVCKNDSSIVC